jgi:predicted MPP superfamily phosphohydrolase
MRKTKLLSLTISSIILTSIIAYIPYTQLITVHAQDNEDSIFRIATTGDISCNEETAGKTVNQINETTPDLVLWLGDLSYDDFSIDCFTDLTSNLHGGDKDKAVIGNHDDESEDGKDAIRNQVITHFNLPAKGYWSKTIDVPNNSATNDILLVGMDSAKDSSRYKKDSEQYNFTKRVLENSNASLKIVLIHKPFLSCDCKHGAGDPGENNQFNTYHHIFRDTGVDLVLQGHNHNVQYFKPIESVKYIVSGAGGKSNLPNYQLTDSPKPAQFRKDQTFGFTLIDADFATNKLNGTFITNQGTAMNDSQFKQSFGEVPQQPGNETFNVNVGKGNAIFVPSNQSNANKTIAVDEGIAVLPKP